MTSTRFLVGLVSLALLTACSHQAEDASIDRALPTAVGSTAALSAPADWVRLSSYRGVVVKEPRSWVINWGHGPEAASRLLTTQSVTDIGGACPRVPPGEASITVREELRDSVSEDTSTPRPEHVVLANPAPEQWPNSCTQPREVNLRFVDAGRSLNVHVDFGEGAFDSPLKATIEQILNLMWFRPADALRLHPAAQGQVGHVRLAGGDRTYRLTVWRGNAVSDEDAAFLRGILGSLKFV